MRHLFIRKCGSSSIDIFFGGWGSGPELFGHMAQDSGNDCLFVWDYRDADRYGDEAFRGKWLELAGLTEGYSRIRIIGWSLGVAVAELFMRAVSAGSTVCGERCVITENGTAHISAAIAVNGTPFPADDSLGIPVKIFRGALDGLSEISLAKFRRRMCSGELESFLSHLPDRGLDELREELGALYAMSERMPSAAEKCLWSTAVIGERDMIFPSASQKRAWEGKCSMLVTGEAHWCPETFSAILSGNTGNIRTL